MDRSLTFGEWLGVTLELERQAFGQDPPSFQGDRLGDFFLQMGFAAADEIHEMMDECGYKAWVTDRGWVNREAFISEAADAMHFIALLLASVRCSGSELTEAYMLKVQKNYQRQQGVGDDERLRRCPHCKRSLDDVGFVWIHRLGSDWTACGGCRMELGTDFVVGMPQSLADKLKETP